MGWDGGYIYLEDMLQGGGGERVPGGWVGRGEVAFAGFEGGGREAAVFGEGGFSEAWCWWMSGGLIWAE